MTGLPKPTTGKGKIGCPIVYCEAPKTAAIELLVGGPYKKNGRDFPYGHVALRVKTAVRERVYDYGRYGATWGVRGSEGEGILRVWSDFGRYISGEKATGRETIGYRFALSESDAEKVILFYEKKVSGIIPHQDRGYMRQYRIEDYDSLNRNCTTQALDGAEIAIPYLMEGSASHNKGTGLSFLEKAAATAVGWPRRVFMPADLGNHLGALQADREPTSVEVYKQ